MTASSDCGSYIVSALCIILLSNDAAMFPDLALQIALNSRNDLCEASPQRVV